MRCSAKAGSALNFALAIIVAGFFMTPGQGWCFDCSAGQGDPPFLSYGVKSNLLMLLDNSASSYDLAYIGASGSCFDGPKTDPSDPAYGVDTYISTTSYAGYFEPSTWYVYNFTAQRFEPKATEADAKTVCDGATGTQYNNDSRTDDVCVTMTKDGAAVPEGEKPDAVTAFAGKGNFLNWVATSKFDVQKKILTGGKYDSANQKMVMESRGCSARRYVKELTLDDDMFLTLAIKQTSSTDPTTEIEIFQVNGHGFDNQACQDALDEMTATNPVLGTIKGDIDSCLEYGPNQSYVTGAQPAFNQAIQTCWYASKHGWPTDLQHTTSLRNQCEAMYATKPPPTILPNDPGYVCYGQYNGNWDIGYVGRCFESGTVQDIDCSTTGHSSGDEWEVGSGSDRNVYLCQGEGDGDGILEYWVCTVPGANLNKCDKTNPADWQKMVTVIGGANIWTDDDYDGDGTVENTAVTQYEDVDKCIDDALRDFCGVVQVPEVIDPTDLQQSTGEVWNIPGMLVDSGVLGQLDQPLATMKGDIYQSSQPRGLIQKYDDVIRMGTMSFNKEGSASECTQPNPYVLYSCTEPTNKDGAHLDTAIGSDPPGVTTHGDNLVAAINALQANTWTPLAEAYYDALGYYGQDVNRRINPGDFPNPDLVGRTTDPVTNWCQDNNILIITEGASTADLNSSVQGFVTNHLNDNDADGTSGSYGCNASELSASTMLDDLTYFGWNAPLGADANGIYVNPTQGGHDKMKIKTHIVTSGSLRDTGVNGECNPTTLMTDAADNGGTILYPSNDQTELENNLQQVLEGVRKSASAGSAASVISSSRGGEGAVYQAIFWPSLSPANNNGDPPIKWAGEVHSLMVDAQGFLYEDTDGDHELDLADDQRVIIYFDELDNATEACYTTLNADGTCPAASKKTLDQVHFLWSANNWLAKINEVDIKTNRYNYISDAYQRNIFTWEDLNNDGIVDEGTEKLPFSDSTQAGSTLGSHLLTDYSGNNRGKVIDDLRAANPSDSSDTTQADSIINWVRGYDPEVDQSANPLRSRWIDWDHPDLGSGKHVWRLGDIINSTPTVVTRPSEGLQFLYFDNSYADFADKYRNRRNMVYFGGNDGMLHAINAGFYSTLSGKPKFYLCLDENGVPSDGCDTAANPHPNGVPELGAEMWAYVPYNLLPHLKCLTDPGYEHKYFVDQRPRVFDAQIFLEEAACTSSSDGYKDPACIHPHGWGTVMVGAMRLGGAPVDAYPSLNNHSYDHREFTSAYFIMDITDPENPPKLLAELTSTDSGLANMGYTVPIPSVVTMIDDEDINDDGFLDASEDTVPPLSEDTNHNRTLDAGEDTNNNGILDQNINRTTSNWYLILGSGPTTLYGESDQAPRVAVVDLRRLVGYDKDGVALTKDPFRIPTAAPVASDERGSFVLSGSGNGFVSDMITADFDLDPDYMSDAVYFGTVEGSFSTSWSGKMYRLVTRKMQLDADGNPVRQVVSAPHEWGTLLGVQSPSEDINGNGVLDAGEDTNGNGLLDSTVYYPNPSLLINAGKPIVAASSVGTDGQNYWVYFGTGRFFDAEDKGNTDTQRYFGIKEPVAANGDFSWGTVEYAFSANQSGDRGLVDVSDIQVSPLSGDPASANLTCVDGTTNCLPTVGGTTVATFATLDEYINPLPGDLTYLGKDGWFRDFPQGGERNLGQATLLGGLVTFTTYQPFTDPCMAEGLSNLYGLYYKTGTAWYEEIFSGSYDPNTDVVHEQTALGRGLATTPNLHVGKGAPTAFVQTSTGAIKEVTQSNLPIQNFKTGRTSWRPWNPAWKPQ